MLLKRVPAFRLFLVILHFADGPHYLLIYQWTFGSFLPVGCCA